MVVRKKETAISEAGFPVCKHRTNCTTLNGLRLKVTRLSAGLASLFDGVGYCHNVPTRARIAVLARMSEYRGRSLFFSIRRLIATSRYARGFSFGVNRDHGIVAPSYFVGAIRPQFLTGSRGGGFRAYRFLMRGNSYPPRSALPVGKGVRFNPIALGAFAMMLTLSSSVSTAFHFAPEPIYKPVTSATTGAVSYDVSSDVNAIVELLANEYNSTINDSSVYGRFRFNVLRGVAVEILRACDEALGRTYTPCKVIGG